MVEPEESEASLGEMLQGVVSFLRRRRWWIAPPACLVAILSALALPHIPARYTSDATVMVVQPQVSPLYVVPASNGPASDVITNLSREVLSRPRLLRIIDELGLFPGIPRTDVLADDLRDAIFIEPLGSRNGDYSSFRLSFSANSPQLAQAVISRIASLFIEENLKTQGAKVEANTSFLNSQVADAKRKLDEQEARLNMFRLRNLDQLSEGQSANSATIAGLRTQLQATMDGLTRARIQRDAIESVLTGNLARLSTERTTLLGRFTAAYPSVIAKDSEIARTRALLERLHGSKRDAEEPAGSGAEEAALSQLRTQIETNAAEIANLSNNEKRLNAEIADYQDRLRRTPIADAQIAGLVRDRDQYAKDYAELLKKQSESQSTATVELGQQGQHFQIVDPASLPIEPSAPNPRKILLGGIGAGLFAGLALALFVEIRQPSFHSEKQISRSFPAPLVIGVPLMLTVRERRAQRWRYAGEWVLGCALVVVVAIIEVRAYLGSLPS